MVNMTLYQIDEAIYDLVNDDGDFDQTKYDALQGLRKEKLEGVALAIKNLTAEANMLQAEEKNLASRRRVCENKAKRLREFLTDALEEGEKLVTPKVAVSWASSKHVEIDDPDSIPPEYLKIKDPDIDKTGIRDAINAGKVVPGARMVTNPFLRIK